MLISTPDCGCGASTIPVTPPTCQKCHTPLTMTNIQELVWLQGLDEGLCVAFQRLSDVLGLRDCTGTRISQETPIVTCAAFQAKLCEIIAGLADGGEAIPEVTQLVGADCKLYTVPPSGVVPSETPNTVTDTPTVNLSATGTLGRNISAAVVVSPQPNNDLVALADGLFVDSSASGPTTCQDIQAFPTGTPAVPGTFLVGADCQIHQVPASDPITVSDTSSINLTLTGQNLAADLILSPDSIGAITGDGLEITCADVLVCAPPVTVIDTSTVDLSIVGQQLSAALRVSSSAGNDLTVDAFGLYLDVCDEIASLPQNGTAVPDQTLLVGSDCQLYTLPEATVTGVTDTSTVDLSLVGGLISANVIVALGQLISATAQGISLTCEVAQDCVFGVTNDFWTYDDALNQVLFNPSDDVGNAIIAGSDGRPFVAPTVVTVTDTSCINLTATDNDITAAVVISPNANNGIQCLGNGLFAEAQDFEVLGDSTDCIIVQVTEGPPDTFTVSAIPVISPDAGNSLVCQANGLFTPSEHTTVSEEDVFAGQVFPALALASDITFGLTTVTINNPSPDRSVRVSVSVGHPSISAEPLDATNSALRIDSIIDYALPGLAALNVPHQTTVIAGITAGAAPFAYTVPGGGTTVPLSTLETTIPPSGAGTVSMELRLRNGGTDTPDVTIGAYGILIQGWTI